MLNVIIIENETPAVEMLVRSLAETSMEVKITAKIRTVKEGINYFISHSDADLIFSDIRLSDGLSFEIFKQSGVNVPVIFTTDFDEFMMMAFENNGIEYLLKPINKSDLEKALLKYKKLQTHFLHSGINKSADSSARLINARKKTRLLVKKERENITLKFDDVTLFYTENKVVYAIDRFSEIYISDKTLSELQEELDETVFFRANRQYIININYIKGFRLFERVKLAVNFNIPEINHSITISQETAPAFKKWICEA